MTDAACHTRVLPRRRRKLAKVDRIWQQRVWRWVYWFAFRPTFITMHAYRCALLRMFGATIGRGVCIDARVNIRCPWHLTIDQGAFISHDVILDCQAPIHIGVDTRVSQHTHLCTATYDYTNRDMPIVTRPITVGDHVWLAADVFVGPGVSIGNRVIVGARASVFSNVTAGQRVTGDVAMG